MKKLTTLILVAVMVLSTVLPAAAKEDTNLVAAINLAKSFFPATDNFTSFWSGQDTYDGRTMYYLYWTDAQKEGRQPATLNVTVDSQRQLVTGYNYEPSYSTKQAQTYPVVPTYGKEHTKQVAEDFAHKLAPEQFKLMQLLRVDEPVVRIEERGWALYYTYNYVQYVNGIPFPTNYLSVRVNADTGEVQHYSLAWADYEFPSNSGALTVEQAEEVFKANGLKLVYLRKYDYRLGVSTPFLAYTLEDGRMLQIDAFTGEVTKGNYYYYRGDGLAKTESADMHNTPSPLTPWELQEIELVAGLLTAEEAAAKASEIIGLSEEAELRVSRLYEDKSQSARFWSLEWQYMVEEYYVGASARVNASTGEIDSFYYWDKMYDENTKPQLTYAEALTIAQGFLKQWLPSKYSTVELASTYEPIAGEPLPYQYSFTFSRKVNGIPVIGDSLSLTVQHTKRVSSLYTNWYQGEFASPNGALTADEMNEKFLEQVGLELGYVLTTVEAELSAKFTKPVVKLVYMPKELNSYNFDPFTGKNTDYSGKEIVAVTKPEYSDILAHWAKADIARLVELGLLRLPGTEFKPDDVIKLGDLLQMLSDACGYQDNQPILPLWLKSYQDSSYAGALGFGVNRGIIAEADDVDPEELVTREVLAYYLARMKGYSNVLDLKGIWTAPYQDFSAVSDEYKAGVAIAHVLGLMGRNSSKFLPKDYSTRAQVAVILSRMLDGK